MKVNYYQYDKINTNNLYKFFFINFVRLGT